MARLIRLREGIGELDGVLLSARRVRSLHGALRVLAVHEVRCQGQLHEIPAPRRSESRDNTG